MGLQAVAGSGYSWGGDSLVSNGKVVLGTSCSWVFFPGIGRDASSSPPASLSLPVWQHWGSVPHFPLTKRFFGGKGGSFVFLAVYCIFSSALAMDTLRHRWPL